MLFPRRPCLLPAGRPAARLPLPAPLPSCSRCSASISKPFRILLGHLIVKSTAGEARTRGYRGSSTGAAFLLGKAGGAAHTRRPPGGILALIGQLQA